jgi:hypothetical protein
MKKKRNLQLENYHLVPNSSGIILDSIWVKNDFTEVKIKSAFGGEWNFRLLKDGEESL